MSQFTSIALDLGTTAIKAGLLDRHGLLQHVVSCPAPGIAGEGGRFEGDALAYARCAEQVLVACMVRADGCTTLGLCSQRSSFLLWERASGKPVTPLISWQDDRGAASCEALREHEPHIRERTGLPLTPYYFAPKLRALLLNQPQFRMRLEKDELLAGTLDTYLIWRWSGGRHFITDASMAARTLLMDVRRLEWSRELCDLFGIPIGILPQVMPSAGIAVPLEHGLVLLASLGDQSAAVYAGLNGNESEVMVNLGTGGFIVRNFPEDTPALPGYLYSLLYQGRDRHPHFAIEGTLNSIAAALTGYPVSECRFEDLAVDAIYCTAEPSGLGAPYFRRDIGLRFSQQVGQLSQLRIAALLLEAIIFRVARILEDFYGQANFKRIYLSGGLSGLHGLQQGIASCVPCELHLLTQSEASLLGAALLASGHPAGAGRIGLPVEVPADTHRLRLKYQHWKSWLDQVLAGSR